MHGGNFLVKDNPMSIDQMAFGVTEETLTGLHCYIIWRMRTFPDRCQIELSGPLDVLSNDVN
jgi:hypothetical protein